MIIVAGILAISSAIHSFSHRHRLPRPAWNPCFPFEPMARPSAILQESIPLKETRYIFIKNCEQRHFKPDFFVISATGSDSAILGYVLSIGTSNLRHLRQKIRG